MLAYRPPPSFKLNKIYVEDGPWSWIEFSHGWYIGKHAPPPPFPLWSMSPRWRELHTVLFLRWGTQVFWIGWRWWRVWNLSYILVTNNMYKLEPPSLRNTFSNKCCIDLCACFRIFIIIIHQVVPNNVGFGIHMVFLCIAWWCFPKKLAFSQLTNVQWILVSTFTIVKCYYTLFMIFSVMYKISEGSKLDA